VVTRGPSAASWLERVADSGEPPARRHDYWDTDEDDKHFQSAEAEEDEAPFRTSPFAPVTRLNRVRATPVPPQEDED
jgi:hypothetical protein